MFDVNEVTIREQQSNLNLIKILPEKTLELPYLSNQQEKINLLQKINRALRN